MYLPLLSKKTGRYLKMAKKLFCSLPDWRGKGNNKSSCDVQVIGFASSTITHGEGGTFTGAAHIC